VNAWQRLLEAIDELSLPGDARVLVALSGGADSVALALAFHAASMLPKRTWRLRLGHINHGLRGADSDGDEAFVREFGRRLELEVETARVDTRAHAAERHRSIETAARELRYRELERMLRAWSGDFIAVGHHADDQAEVVLMNLVRGAGLDGLSGMSPRSGVIVRPFLQIPKETISAALRDRDEPHRVDGSNEDVKSRRNFFRHRVLSTLAEIRPDIGTTIAETAHALREDADYFHSEAGRALAHMDVRSTGQLVSASTGVFRALLPAVQGRAIRLLVEALVGDMHDLSREHVHLMTEAITATNGPRGLVAQLPHSLQIEVDHDRFQLYRGVPDATGIDHPVELGVPGEVETVLGLVRASIEEADPAGERSPQLTVSGPYHAFCDAESLGHQLQLRSRRPGDRIALVHAAGSKKLQDLFVDAKIPRRKRDRMLVVENVECIVWVPGFGVDRRFAIRPKTERVAHLSFHPFI
jgi:tRNA(Ile)-lysidine synthase